MSDPRIGSLERFFIFIFLTCGGCAFQQLLSMSISTEHVVGLPRLPALSCIYCLQTCEDGQFDWRDLIFHCCFDWHSYSNQECCPSPPVVEVCLFFFFFPVSFTLKGVKKIYCGNWLLETLLCLEFISSIPAVGDFLRAAVINRTPGLVNQRSASLVKLQFQEMFTGDLHFLNPMCRGAWEAAVHGVAKSRT